MRVLVTGATGFIGRRLVQVLEEHGHSVTVALRNPSWGDRLGHNKGSPPSRRSIVVGEVGRQTDWSRALEGADAVVHLAARAHVLDETASDEEAFQETNARGTRRLVEQAIEARVARFVLMSSIGAVTTSCDARVTQETPCEPQTHYGQSKLAAERALIDCTNESDMDWVILRPTLVYGPGNPGNMARLVSLVKRGWPLPLGAIKNRRSFTFIDNLVEVVRTVLRHEKASNEIFFVADGEDLSTPELIKKIAEISGAGTRLLPVPLAILQGIARGADRVAATTGIRLPLGSDALERLVSSLYVDIQPLRTKLGWKPPFSVDHGLRSMLVAT